MEGFSLLIDVNMTLVIYSHDIMQAYFAVWLFQDLGYLKSSFIPGKERYHIRV